MNNPLNSTDPSGYFSLKGFFKAAVAVTSGAATAAYATSYATATGATVGTMAYSAAYTASAASMTGSIIGGVAGGFTGGLLASNGDINAALKGGVTGGVFGGLDSYASMNKFSPFQTTAANAATGGAAARMQGGSFAEGFRYSGISTGASEAYKYVTTYTPDPLPGKELPSGAYNERLGVVPRSTAVFGNNDPVTGNFFDDFAKQGGFLGKLANAIPIANSGAAFHDSLFVREIFGLTKSAWTNIPTMLPSGIIAIGANLDGPLSVQLSTRGGRR